MFLRNNQEENTVNLQVGDTIECNVCSDSGQCVQCHWFDSNYHGGYCDKHRIDVNPYNSCRDFWRD